MEQVKECPICSGESFSRFLNVKDYTVSKKYFELVKCNQCELVMTSPRPIETELGQYYLSEDYVSHAGQAKSAFDLVYMIARKFTLRWKINLVNASTKKKLKILDYGCGTGDFLAACKKEGMEISGIEPSESARKIAETKTGITVKKGVEVLQDTFDRITLWHVLEHIPNINEVMNKLNAHLAQDGFILIAVPNHKSMDAQQYAERWAGYDVPRHLWHFSKHNIERLAQNHGLKLVKVIPMVLDSYYVSMLSEKHRKGKATINGYIKGLSNGFSSNQNAKASNEYSSLIYILKK